MANEKKQSDSVPMNKLNEVANENYKKLSEEFVKSMRAARTGNIRSTARIFGINQARVQSALLHDSDPRLLWYRTSFLR